MSLELTAAAPTAPDDVEGDVWLECIECGETFAPFSEIRYTCDDCDGLLEARYEDPPTFDDFEGRGVWRYSAALPFEEGVSLPEGGRPCTASRDWRRPSTSPPSESNTRG